MKNNMALFISAVILSISIIFSAVYLGNAISLSKTSSESAMIESQSLLMNADQAAEYIGITVDTLITRIKKEKIERHSLNVYDTYRFIPYMEIDGVIYFTKSELEKWVEYQTINRQVN